MTYMGPPGTPQWHQAGQADAARGAHVFNQSGHGAIAYSPTARSVSTAWGYSSTAGAQAAVREGMPADVDVYLGHHNYVALAQGPAGHAFGSGTSSLRAMENALKAAGGPGPYVTKLINTNSGELDPQQQWEQGLRYGQMRRAVGKGVKWYLMACLIVLFVIAVAAIGAHVPVLAFILIGLAIAFAVWRYRKRR
jgi:hypothetical protein